MEPIHIAGCVILKDGAILLLRRKARGWYELPGGKIEPGEGPAAAAAREIREELGCEAEIVRKLGSKGFALGGKSFLYHWFLARIVSGVPHALEREVHDACAYVPLDGLDLVPLSPNMQNLRQDLAEKKIALSPD